VPKLPTSELLLAGGVASAAAFVGAAIAARTQHLWRPPDCTGVGEKGGNIAGVTYLERMRGGAKPEDEVPMVIAFHSLGATPYGFAGSLKGIGPARLILPGGEFRTGGGGYLWWKDGIIKGSKPDKLPTSMLEWSRAADRMAYFIDQITRCRPTKGKPIVTGVSQGGHMSYLMASKYPRLVEGAVAVSGGLLPGFWNDNMAPTLGIHGRGDTTVPFKGTQEYANTMMADGADFAFQAYDSSGHGTNSAMKSAWIDGVEWFRNQADQTGFFS